MTDDDLLRAVEAVREHFTHGAPLTRNTVLAAYLRSRGASANGPSWEVAKAALAVGMSFEEAADLGSSQLRPRRSDTGETSTMATRGLADGSAIPAAAADQVATSQGGTNSALNTPIVDGRSAAEKPERVTTIRGSSARSGAHALDWYPKIFAPGDLVGEGAKKLLGTPNIPLVSVLVRETAQNSWDARTAQDDVRFTLNLRRLDSQEHETIRDSILTGAAGGLSLSDSLARRELWVLEISDRGTKGLGGPVRNDLAVGPAEVTDFMDLIFNIGAPRDVDLGGGTYGFGKTVAYRASACGTVIFWSRSREERGIQDRLIASAFGDSFTMGRYRYTGRHWWGRLCDDGARVEPMVGTEACELASAAFVEGFGPEESGTSMMIIDPDLGFDSPELAVQALADAVSWHLWPKVLGSENHQTPMNIEVLLDGAPVDIPDPAKHPVFDGYADCLKLLRAVQSGGSYTPYFNTEIVEVRSMRPDKLLGHLALSRYPHRGSKDSSDVAVFEGASSHVAYMRHDAELVVRYQEMQRLDADGLQWAGVFKPVRAVDNSFAAAEPPAHDDWQPSFIADRAAKRDVNVALKRVRELVASFLSPTDMSSGSVKSGRSVASLAESLSGLVGAVPGNSAGRGAAGHGSAAGRRRPQANVLEVRQGPRHSGRRMLAVSVAMNQASKMPALVRATVGVGVEGSMDKDNDLVRLVGWLPGTVEDPLSADDADPAEPTLVPGGTSWLLLDVDASVAVDISLSAEEVGA